MEIFRILFTNPRPRSLRLVRADVCGRMQIKSVARENRNTPSRSNVKLYTDNKAYKYTACTNTSDLSTVFPSHNYLRLNELHGAPSMIAPPRFRYRNRLCPFSGSSCFFGLGCNRDNRTPPTRLLEGMAN